MSKHSIAYRVVHLILAQTSRRKARALDFSADEPTKGTGARGDNMRVCPVAKTTLTGVCALWSKTH